MKAILKTADAINFSDGKLLPYGETKVKSINEMEIFSPKDFSLKTLATSFFDTSDSCKRRGLLFTI